MLLGDMRFLDMMLWPLGEYSARVSALRWCRSVSCRAGADLRLPARRADASVLQHVGAVHVRPGAEATWARNASCSTTWCASSAPGWCSWSWPRWRSTAAAPPYPTLRPAASSVLLAFGMLFPNHRLMLIFPPIPMRARVRDRLRRAGVGHGCDRTQSGVAHFAHLGGMAFGFLMIQYWRGRWPFRRRPRQR